MTQTEKTEIQTEKIENQTEKTEIQTEKIENQTEKTEIQTEKIEIQVEKIENQTEIQLIEEKLEAQIALNVSLKIRLNELSSSQSYGSTKGAFLKTMKVMTSPFARYHQNLNTYLENPDLHQLEKDIIRVQDLCVKIPNKNLNSEKKIFKIKEKLFELENKVLANPAYLSHSYSESLNVKETLEEVEHAYTALSVAQNALMLQIMKSLPTNNLSKELLEQLASPL
jgi:hypothetical protein